MSTKDIPWRIFILTVEVLVEPDITMMTCVAAEHDATARVPKNWKGWPASVILVG